MAESFDTLDKEEADAYKAQAVNAKFKQQIAYGVGAAMVFGLVSVLGQALAHMATAAITTAGATTVTAMAGAAAGPILGLAALGVLGVGLLYLSAKFLSENTMLDQHLQAKQISSATRLRVQAIQKSVQPKVQQFPESFASKTETTELDAPTNNIGNERELADTVIARGNQMRAV